MAGRRSHVRYSLVHPPEGVLRVMQDVLIQAAGGGEMVAISREAGVVGEAVSLAPGLEEQGRPLPARVVESQPVVVDGAVRHRLRLEATRVQAVGVMS